MDHDMHSYQLWHEEGATWHWQLLLGADQSGQPKLVWRVGISIFSAGGTTAKETAN